jgi:hypothetical protein
LTAGLQLDIEFLFRPPQRPQTFRQRFRDFTFVTPGLLDEINADSKSQQNIADLRKQFWIINRQNCDGVLMIKALVDFQDSVEFSARARRGRADGDIAP